VTEVRPGSAQVLVGVDGEGTWIESGSLLAEPTLPDAELERLRQVFSALGGIRIEFDLHEWTVYTEAVPADAVDRVRSLLGQRLASFTLAAHGVHELAARLVLSPSD